MFIDLLNIFIFQIKVIPSKKYCLNKYKYVPVLIYSLKFIIFVMYCLYHVRCQVGGREIRGVGARWMRCYFNFVHVDYYVNFNIYYETCVEIKVMLYLNNFINCEKKGCHFFNATKSTFVDI